MMYYDTLELSLSFWLQTTQKLLSHTGAY